MKNYILNSFATVVLFFFTLGAVAENTATFIKTIDGEATESNPGTVAYSYGDGTGTITVTPADGYYLTAENLTVIRTISGSNAQTRSEDLSEFIYENVTITATNADADPNGTTIYTFTVDDTNYDYEITADFQGRINISDYAVTLAKENETYTGSAITPTVSSVTLDGKTVLSATDYTVSYQQGETAVESLINAGTYTVVVTGARTYTGTAKASFIISKADATLSFSAETATGTIGQSFTAPTLTKAPTGITVTYASSNTDAATVVASSGAVTLVGVGTTTITATFAGDDNYNEASATYKLTVAAGQAAVATAPTANTLTYTGAAQALVTAGKATNGTMQYSTDGTHFSATIPTASAAGNYTVSYKAVGNANYDDSDVATVAVTIKKAAGTISFESETVGKAYGDEAFIVAVTKTGDGTVTYSTSDEAVATVNTETGEVNIVGLGTATITATVADGTNYTYEVQSANYELTVSLPTPTITFADGLDYVTFYSGETDYAVPQSMVAYIVTGVSGTTVTVQQVSYLKAGYAFLMKDAEAPSIDATADDVFKTNMLKYADENVTATGTQYVLYHNQFVKATVGEEIPSGYRYLELSAPAGSRTLTIGDGSDGSTAISSVAGEADGKGAWYDMQGRKVQKSARAGLYIVNGKKILINK